MTPKRKRRIYYLTLLLLGAGLVTALVLYALRQNINFYYTPSELLVSLPQHRVRIGGVVSDGTLRYDNALQLSFAISDFKQEVLVHYNGILPDLFREGQGVVAFGRLEKNIFYADQILAKHDENYRPPL